MDEKGKLVSALCMDFGRGLDRAHLLRVERKAEDA